MSMALQADSKLEGSIHSDTAMGTVTLTVSDMSRSRVFYERVLGLRSYERPDGSVAFGPTEANALVELWADSSAPPLDRRRTGLYHLAILVPSRLDLALALVRLIQTRWPLDGASDHLVSEALYLSDPDGNGIEIYRDRPRADWRYANGQLEMATLPLDLDDLMRELDATDGIQVHAPSGTRIGHVHLQVAGLDEAERFYSGVLGFDVVVRGYPGALFVSAGGYHHHVGLNTWHSAGAPTPDPGAIGLRSFAVALPNLAELERVRDRLSAAGIEAQALPAGGFSVRDPSGNLVVLRSAAS
jgi:catechol 2,3-dioxygenase